MKRARREDPPNPARKKLARALPEESVDVTRTRCCALTLPVFASHVPGLLHAPPAPDTIRRAIDAEVDAVSRAMLYGSMFLEFFLRTLLKQSPDARLPPALDLELVVRLAFTAMQTRSNPTAATLDECPGFREAKAAWQAIWPAAEHGVSISSPNSLMYAYQAYWSTLLSNYTTIALEAHVYWTTRYIVPEHRGLLKRALIHRTASFQDLMLLPEAIRALIVECRRIQYTEFSNETALAATNLRWRCMILLDAEQVPKPFVVKGQAIPYHPKRFNLVPWCRKAARFIRLDMQWALKTLGLPRPTRQEKKDVLAAAGLGDETADAAAQLFSPLKLVFANAPVIKQYAKSAAMRFGKTVLTDGVQLHVPYLATKRVRVDEKAAAVRKNNRDLKSRSPAELRKALDSPSPCGLFHMQAAAELTPSDPAFEHAIGLDPGVVNLVTTTRDFKLSNSAFYGQAYKVRVFDPGEGRPSPIPEHHQTKGKAFLEKGTVHSRRTRHRLIPVDIERTQAAMKHCAPKAAGLDLDTFVANLTAYLPCAEKLQAYYRSRSRRALRLTRDSNARKRLKTVVADICPDPNTVVVFGANFFGWKATPKGTVAGPAAVKAIRRALAKSRVVVLADEYMTSRRHLECGCELEVDPADPREKYCSTCRVKVDRDMNAAHTILEVWREFIRTKARPAHLWRAAEDGSPLSSL